MRRVTLARYLFAIASASMAIWSARYGHFAWHAVPASMAGRDIWVYGPALIVAAASIGLCFSRTALQSVLAIGAYLAISAGISVPQIVARPLGIDAWYPFCEALTSLVGAWVLYALLRRQSQAPETPMESSGSVRAAQAVFGLTCVFYGVSHFLYADYTASLVPTWLPDHFAFAYFTGLGHVAAGVAIIVGMMAGLAATLEALMMSLFGLLVWVPSFFAQPRPLWAQPPEHQWSELVVTLMVAAAAWIVAISLGNRPQGRRELRAQLGVDGDNIG